MPLSYRYAYITHQSFCHAQLPSTLQYSLWLISSLDVCLCASSDPDLASSFSYSIVVMYDIDTIHLRSNVAGLRTNCSIVDPISFKLCNNLRLRPCVACWLPPVCTSRLRALRISLKSPWLASRLHPHASSLILIFVSHDTRIRCSSTSVIYPLVRSLAASKP